jgi:hypothetical protein
MGRNYFSKHGGPYFINDGLSKHHDHDHNEPSNHEHIKPDSNLFYGFVIGFLSLLLIIGIALTILN